MHRLRVTIAVVALTTTLAACSSSDRNPVAVDSNTGSSTRRTTETDASEASDASDDALSTPASGAPSVPADTDGETPDTTDAGAPTTSAEEVDVVTFGPGEVDVLDPTIGLDALASYHAVLTMTFSGTRAGAAESWQLVRDVVVNRDAASRILTTTQTGLAPSTRRRIEIGRSRYEHEDDGACETAIIDPEEQPFITDSDPVAWLPAVRGADDDGTGMVDGVTARHATFDERAFGSLDPATSVGEIWTAVDGGHVLRLHIESTGGSGYLGHDATGTLVVDYALDSLGAPISAEVPADCDLGAIDAPMPDDARDVSLLPGVVELVTSLAPAEVIAYYEQQLALTGWQIDGLPMNGPAGTLRTFGRGPESLLVLARTDAAGTLVTITQDRG